MTWIIHSEDVSPHTPVGGKACALASAQAAGLLSPAFLVVTSSAFHDSLSEEQRGALADDGRERAAALSHVMPSRAVARAIRDAARSLCPDNGSFAVRSSAGDEDSAGHSLAGQLETFLDVDADDIPHRVADVWRSGFSARLLAYRQQRGLALATSAPAVIVQRMVRADAAGVAFSADPVSGRRGVAVVSAVAGSGAALVSGEADGETWYVDRAGHAISCRETTASGVLTGSQVQAVASLARRAAAHFGQPQDIEWAYEGNTLWLLQSRPITTLARISDPDGRLRVWDNSNLVESYSGVTTPLTFSFASEVYEHVYREFCRLMRVDQSTIVGEDEAFRNMLGLIRGRMYYNLANWYRVLALLPGFSLNRRFMEQMMGIAEGLPDAADRTVKPRGAAPRRAVDRLRNAGRLAQTVTSLVWQHFTIERRIRAFRTRLDGALATAGPRRGALADRPASPHPPLLADMSADGLVAHYRDLRRQLLLTWDAPIVNDFFAMIFHGALGRLTKTWCGDVHGTLQNALLRDTEPQGALVSAEPARCLQRLAQLAGRDRRFADLLASGSAGRIAAAVREHLAFEAEYRAYLEKFGDRTMNELKLETRTLHDDPLPLLRAAGQLAQSLRDNAIPDDESIRAGAQEPTAPKRARPASNSYAALATRRVADAMAGHPLRRALFDWVLRHARARVRDRENLRLERTRVFGRVRRIFVELGRRFHADGLLNDPRDVFYLTVEEVLAIVEGRSVCASLRDLTEVRRREFLEYEQASEPEGRLESVGIVCHPHALRCASATPHEQGDSRQGLGCCPGVVSGPVCVVTDAGSIDVGSRAVLVASHTDPGWVLFFPSAIAVVVERGSLLSHTAIVARELGIPAVVSVPGVTRWLKNGDWVEVDGSTGRVQRIARPSASTTSDGLIAAATVFRRSSPVLSGGEPSSRRDGESTKNALEANG